MELGEATGGHLHELRSVPMLRWVHLEVGRSGLTLQYNSAMIFDKLPLPGWAPQPGWQLAFAAAAAELTDNHWIDDLRVATGAFVERTPTAVHLALNGQQFGPQAATPFEYVPGE